METRERWRALLVTALVVSLAAVPGVRLLASGDAPDGFPLSTYPMFSRDRGRVVEVPTVVAVADDGAVERLSPVLIAGTDQVIQANAAVRAAVAGGERASRELCAEVAERVGEPTGIEVVVERHDVIDWAAGERDPLERRTIARCGVPAP